MAGSYGGNICLDSQKARLVKVRSNFENPKSNHDRIVSDHHFNHAAEIIVPGLTSEETKQLLVQQNFQEPTDKIFTWTGNLSHFLSDEIRSLLSKGRLQAISLNTELDRGDNVIALVHTGLLVLSLNKHTYEALGLEGKSSKFDKQRFLVHINLLDPSVKPGQKKYDRIKWCLTDRLEMDFKLLLSWDCGGSEDMTLVQKAFGSDLIISENDMSLEQRVVHAPVINVKDASGEDGLLLSDEADAEILYEALGAMSCDLDMKGSPDDYVNTMTYPEPSFELTTTFLRYKGFVSPQFVANLLLAVRNVAKSVKAPFVALSVWGFQDTPISWNDREHGFLLSGENHFTYVVFGDPYMLYVALGPRDEFSL
eukprot:m.32811 g.32811  ORF g.32811 m.32811 type:complete len:367 (+) comp8452_c0_seq2:133-1233(+)